jgi:hypothetical protein
MRAIHHLGILWGFLIFEGRIMPCGRGTINHCIGPDRGWNRYREVAEVGMGYSTSPAILESYGFLPDVLLAEDKLRNDPVRVTIVGVKDDSRAAAPYRCTGLLRAETRPKAAAIEGAQFPKTPSLVHKPAASEPNCRLNAGRF